MMHPMGKLVVLADLVEVVENPGCPDCKATASRYEELLCLGLASLVEAKNYQEMLERQYIVQELIRESTEWINSEHKES